MSGSPRGSKRKSSAGGSGRANTKRARGTNTKGKAPDVGGAASTSSTGAAPGDAAGAASAEKDKEENETRAHRRNPHGIAPDDVDGKNDGNIGVPKGISVDSNGPKNSCKHDIFS
ncbi:hypothetical protein B0H13DRAFT_1874512 [Mycena leptocephala]|nr:hypothetical protein B0H13DRAFT_1874512 [Mycena leptocephala]